MGKIAARQVHLDFHTSEHIPNVGARFNKKQWQQALKLGRVNSINIFAKCHHGWSYYPTKIGNVHPTLKRDLLGLQIEACHEIGVRAPVYYTIGWSANDAATHPEWCVRKKDGTIPYVNVNPNAAPDDPRPDYSWLLLCPNGGYLALILAQTREICERYDVDGLWYDITNGPACYCDACREGMAREGLSVDDEAAAVAYNTRKWIRLMTECASIVHQYHPEAAIFFNGTTGSHVANQFYKYNTQLDLEDLPTTWGGYDRFPLRARFFARQDRPMIAMSGKFHTSWGEFGGFKHPDAIRFEAAAMIAFGAGCNFGDQLHPSGEMDLATYRNVGEAFRYVQRIEEYGLEGKPFSNLGLWWGVDSTTSTGDFAPEPNHRGVSQMLLEKQIDFEIVDSGDNLSRFEAIVMAGSACLDKSFAAELRAYMRAGGKLLVLGESGLDATTRSGFLLDVGARFVGPARYKIDYLVAGKELGPGLVASPFLNYVSAIRARLTKAAPLAAIREPYFDRTYGHYCGHMNTPYTLKNAPHPGAWRFGNLICLPHPLGKIYLDHGARLHRDLFINALRLIYPERKQALVTDMPSGARVSLIHQPHRRRYVAHLLYGPPMPRGRCQIIEDLVPLHDVPLTLRVPEKILRATLPLEKRKLALSRKAGAVSVTVPRIECHQIAVFEY